MKINMLLYLIPIFGIGYLIYMANKYGWMTKIQNPWWMMWPSTVWHSAITWYLMVSIVLQQFNPLLWIH